MAGTASPEEIPDRTEVATEEDEDNNIDAVQATGLNQQLEGLRVNKNTLHLADTLHTLHEVGQVYYLILYYILGGGVFNGTPPRIDNLL